MSDLICRKTMMRCNTPGTCSPHGGCRDDRDTALAAKDARIAELEQSQGAEVFLTLTGEISKLRAQLASQQQAEQCEDMAEQLERAEIRMMFGDAQEPATPSEDGQMIDTSAWQACNPGCDPEFNGEKGRHCVCDSAKAAMSEKKANSINPEIVDVVGYTTAGMLSISKDLPITGRIGAKCKPDERWNVPLMTVAQHERIVAAKDAEIARLRELHENAHSAAKTLMAEKATLMEQAAHWLEVNAPSGGCIETNIADELRAEAEQLRAQPARQVGGDREDMQTFIELFAERLLASGAANYLKDSFDLEFEATGKKCLVVIRLQHPDKPTPDQMRMEAEARAALAPAAVVMPERDDYHQIAFEIGGTEDGAYHFEADELDNFVARLNRRAIPVELIRRASEQLEAHMCSGCKEETCCMPDTRDSVCELRALLEYH